ncbi:hypothetical protein BDB01DRAFT_830909 [Pilobolus umbonatus]|nr:hypothetical protein BDB01DRAFT_830909 [Pilobolus umbonatus]
MCYSEPTKTIAVDLDQTLTNTLDCLVEWHNHTYGTEYKVSDFDTLDYWKVWGGSREESCYKIREFYESSYFDGIEPINDFALEALKMLKKRRFTLVIVTSRQQFIAQKTKRFVDKHYPGIFDSIYFCNLNLSDAEQLEYITKPKSVICQEIGADVLIDDSLEHAIECSALGVEVLLYDHLGNYRWNHEERIKKTNTRTSHTLTSTSQRLYHHLPKELSPNVHRMFNWKDILNQFPRPSSPLRHCSYSSADDSEDTEEDEEDEEEEEQYTPQYHYFHKEKKNNDYVNQSLYLDYETIEVDELSEDEEEEEQNDREYHYPLWSDNRIWV